MIPYFELHSIPLGPIDIQVWGSLVAAGFLFGGWIAARFAEERGLKGAALWDMAFWVFVAAFVGARLFHAVLYEPGHFIEHPLDLINPMLPGFAMWGGLAGAAAAFIGYSRFKKLDWVAYGDAGAFGLPWGIFVGRLGCFLIHDHPGKLSDFFLAVGYPGGARHDLGLYLSLGGLATGLVFWGLSKRPRGRGFFVGAFFAAEAVIRLGTDFLRVADARYAGLTPTQWLAIPLLAGCLWLAWSRRNPESRAAQDPEKPSS
jgi:phosphatidylglycerol:prolipoprotein diacylglycerol transferase